VIALWVVIGFAYEVFYNVLYLGGVNNQFSAKNMFRRLFPPNVTEFVRFSALLFPAGLLPALSLIVVRRRDAVGWMIAVITIVYFVVIYMQAWTALHQFTPIMVLPLIVFWRVYLGEPTRVRRWLLPAAVGSAALCLVLSLPRHFQINQALRQFGEATEYGVGDYEQSYEAAVRGGSSLYALLPRDYRLKYPEQPWGADRLAWIYYATRPKAEGTEINYIVRPASDPQPEGSTQVMTQDGVSVYVRDLERWQRDREIDLPRVSVSPIYEPILRRTYEFFRAYAERMQPAGGVERNR
jgi:hypothetical protein